ncbi:MAG: metallophosphoesterase, partial [Phycisphaerales bacterium]
MLPAAACVALAALVAVHADPPAAAPALAPFTRDADGRGVEGQVVADTGRPRVQRVAILPDRTTGRAWGIPYLKAAVADLNVAKPDAVFTVGDMVQGYTRSGERYESEVDEYLGIVGALRGMRFYPTAGNHDVISGTRTAGDDAFAQR